MFQYWNLTVFVTRHLTFSVMEIEIECDLIYILLFMARASSEPFTIAFLPSWPHI